MINLDRRLSHEKLKKMVSKSNECYVRVDLEHVEDDIDRYTRMYGNSTGKNDRANIGFIIGHLRRLRRLAKEGDLMLTWGLNNGIIESLPIDMINMAPYKMSTTDYVAVEDSRMIEIEFYDVANAIAFDIMSYDLGYTHDSLQELLKDINIITPYNISVLSKIIGPQCYMDSYRMLFEKSPYYDLGEMELLNFTRDRGFVSKSYREVVEESCKTAAVTIWASVFDKLVRTGEQPRICGVYETSIFIAVPGELEYDFSKLAEDILMTVCGRKFVAQPRIMVY